MVANQVAIGANGVWRIDVDLVSQSQAGNSSVVRVRGTLVNTDGTRSFNNGNVDKSIYGSSSWASSAGGIDVPGHGEQTIIDQQFTVGHDGNGYCTVSYGVHVGATGTFTFGGGGDVTYDGIGLPRIPKTPGQVGTPSRTFSAPSTVTVSWSTPDAMGSAILEFEVQYDDNSSFSSPSSVSSGVSTTKAVTGLAINKTWSFRVRARNALGWGPYSPPTSYAIPGVPGAPPKPVAAYTPPDTIGLTWAAGTDDNGASITGWDIQYSKSSSFASGNTTVTSTTRSKVITDLDIGFTWYFRVRAKNSQGAGAWSTSTLYLVICGPRVKVDGVWKNTILYVKVGGVWKVALPYVKSGGAWKAAGG